MEKRIGWKMGAGWALLWFDVSEKRDGKAHRALCGLPGSFLAGWVIVGYSVRACQCMMDIFGPLQ